MDVEIFTEIRSDRQRLTLRHDYLQLVKEQCERLRVAQAAIVFYPSDFNNKFVGDRVPPSMRVGLSPIHSDGQLIANPMPAFSVNVEATERYSEKALRACIVHEIGHLVHGDCDRWTYRGRFTQWLTKKIADVTWRCFHWSPYWRREFRADAYAADLLGVEGMEAFLTEVIFVDVKDSYSHPSAAKRRQRIEQHFAKLQRALSPTPTKAPSPMVAR